MTTSIIPATVPNTLTVTVDEKLQPDWFVLAGDEVLQDGLRDAGFDVLGAPDPATIEQAQRDLVASILLRRLTEVEADIDQVAAARQKELDWVNMRYDRQQDLAKNRHVAIRVAIEAIASITKDQAAYPAKKKSRTVANGTYGYRSYESKLVVVSEHEALEWAKARARSAVKVTLVLTLEEAGLYFTDPELEGAKMALAQRPALDAAEQYRQEVKLAYELAASAPEGSGAAIAEGRPLLPPGFAIEAGHDDFYGKPERPKEA